MTTGFHMNSMIMKQLKIFNTIVCFISIYVMDSFRRLQKTTQMFLHYETMFTNTTGGCTTKRVVRAINQYIASTEPFTTFPISSFFTFSIKSDSAKGFSMFFCPGRFRFAKGFSMFFCSRIFARFHIWGSFVNTCWHNIIPFKKGCLFTIIQGDL